MKLQNQPPAYFIPQGKPRAWALSNNGAAITLMKKRRSKAHARPWPPGSGDTTNYMHPADANRLWHSFFYHAWKEGLTTTQRAAWEAAAGSFTIKNNDGHVKAPNGMQLFMWWHSYDANYTWQPPYPPNLSPGGWLTAPPDHTLPTPNLSAVALQLSANPNFTIGFTCDQAADEMNAFLQVTRPTSPGCTPNTHKWSRLGPSSIQPGPPTHWGLNITGNYPVPPWTATTSYVASYWYSTSPFGIAYAPGANSSIRGGINVRRPTITCQLQWVPTGPYAATITWGIQSDGSRIGLAIETTGSGQAWIGKSTGYGGGITQVYPSFPHFQNPGQNATYTIQLQGALTNILKGPTLLASVLTGPPSAGDIGIDATNCPTEWSGYSALLPSNLFTAGFNYQAILENPAQGGPRGARLTVGDPDTGDQLHSQWTSFPLEL